MTCEEAALEERAMKLSFNMEREVETVPPRPEGGSNQNG